MIAIRKNNETPEFSEIYLTESKAFFAPGFDPSFAKNMTSFQLRNLVSVNKSQTLISKSDGKGRFRVFFNFGAKWSTPKDTEKDLEKSDEQSAVQPESIITIECDLVAEFKLTRAYEQSELDDFALSSAIHFVIPYWKNYLITQCGLMRLQELVLPDENIRS